MCRSACTSRSIKPKFQTSLRKFRRLIKGRTSDNNFGPDSCRYIVTLTWFSRRPEPLRRLTTGSLNKMSSMSAKKFAPRVASSLRIKGIASCDMAAPETLATNPEASGYLIFCNNVESSSVVRSPNAFITCGVTPRSIATRDFSLTNCGDLISIAPVRVNSSSIARIGMPPP